MITGITRTIFDQLKALGLETRKYNFVSWNDNGLKLNPIGQLKGLIITYNQQEDLYNVEKYEGMNIKPITNSAYTDQLVEIINENL